MAAMFSRATNLKDVFVKATVLEAKFQVRGGHRPAVGETVDMPLSDAESRAAMKQVRILPGTERVVDTGIRPDDLPPSVARRKW